MRNRSIKASVATLVVAAGLLTGCGGGDADAGATTAPATEAAGGNGIADLDATAVLEKSKAALAAAKSYNVAGELEQDGQTASMDISVVGPSLVGYVYVGKGRVNLLRAGGNSYVRPDELFWTASTGDARKAAALNDDLGEKWAQVPAGDTTFGPLFDIADADTLLAPEGSLSKGEEGEVRGTPVVALNDSAGGVLYVATDGEPYPVRLQGTSVEDGLNFSGIGEVVNGATKPAATQVVTLASLMAGAGE